MRIIDSHTHFFPDKVAEAAIPKMEATSGYKACTDGTRAGLIRSMDAAGIQCSLALPVATNPEKVSSINRFSVSVNDSRIQMAGALYPKAPDWRDHIEEIVGLGFSAVKLHPDYQEFCPDEPNLLPFFAALRDNDILVVIHAGEDLSYKPPYGGGPARIAWLIENLSGIKIFAGHMGGYRMWDEVDRCLVGKPVYMDTSFSFGEMSDERLRSMIGRHGAEYVLFGTDSPWLDQAGEIENVLRLGLGSAVEEMIFYDNAVRLLPALAGQGPSDK